MSKEIKPNNLKQALKEIGALDEALVDSVPDKIAKIEEFVFHVLQVKIVTKIGQVKNDVIVSKQTYNKRSFEKFKSSYIYLGFDRIIVLHDPNMVEDKPEVVLPEFSKKEIEAKIRKEYDRKMEARIEKEIAQRMSEEKIKIEKEEKQEDEEEEEESFSPQDFVDQVSEFSNYQKIKAFANKIGIDLTGVTGLEQIKMVLFEYAKEKVVELGDDSIVLNIPETK